MKWNKVSDTLPDYWEHVLAIDGRGFMLQTQRTSMWDGCWGQKGRGDKHWQYWTDLPEVPKDVKKIYE